MIDENFKVMRFIAEYCEETETLITEYDLAAFNLEKFQAEFNELNREDPMFGCYPIQEKNIPFLKKYLDNDIVWDFNQKSYFVEASSI